MGWLISMKHESSEAQECEHKNNNALGIWSTRRMKHKNGYNTKPSNKKKGGAKL